MRQGIKVLAVVGVVAVGLGAWYVGSRGSSEKSNKPARPAEPVSPIGDNATVHLTDTRPPAGETRATPSSTDINSGVVASPPPVGPHGDEERSFRPPAIGTTDPVRPLTPEPPSEPITAAPPQPADTTPPLAPTTPGEPVKHDPADHARTAAEIAATVLPEPPKSSEETPATRPASGTPKIREHVIQAGETYSSLAVKYFGSAKYVSLITKANPGKDPRRLFVGAKVKIPEAPAGATVTSRPETAEAPTPKPALETVTEPLPPIPDGHAYKVQAGEGWYDLAKRFLGDGNRWPELYELNRERVAHNPHALRVGTVIEVPKPVTSKPS